MERELPMEEKKFAEKVNDPRGNILNVHPAAPVDTLADEFKFNEVHAFLAWRR